MTNFLRVASVPACVGYQEQCQWWVGVELGRRLIVLIFIIVFGHNEVKQLTNISSDRYSYVSLDTRAAYLDDHIWSVHICVSL